MNTVETPFSEIHVPVLLERTVELLAPALDKPGAVYVDTTLGMGGHAEAFLRAFPQLRVIGFDRDPQARSIAAQRLNQYSDRLSIVPQVFDSFEDELHLLGIKSVNAVLFDLGVSSLQLDQDDRGFSYSRDTPLDMRMGQDSELTAEKVLAEYDEASLVKIFRDYGEERLAGRYARAIVRARSVTALTTSAELTALIEENTPAALRRSGNPAKRVFQALRIEVNQELSAFESALPQALAMTALGGRIVVLSYHSLEDKLAKNIFQRETESQTPLDLPVELEDKAPRFRSLVRGSEKASPKEIAENPRSASVRLRAVERIREAA